MEELERKPPYRNRRPPPSRNRRQNEQQSNAAGGDENSMPIQGRGSRGSFYNHGNQNRRGNFRGRGNFSRNPRSPQVQAIAEQGDNNRTEPIPKNPANSNQSRARKRYPRQKKIPGEKPVENPSTQTEILQEVDRQRPKPRNKKNGPKQDRPEQTQEDVNALASSVSNLISRRKKFIQNADQRIVLLDKIRKNTLECCICMEKIRAPHQTWSCQNCFNLLHLKCAKEWAKSTINKSKDSEDGWRCPYCQNKETKIPHRYFCFCGAEENPSNDFGSTPHSCDSPCSRPRSCIHKCPLLCHPGACPPCEASGKVRCNCGKTEAFVKCGKVLKCENICDKLLPCGTCRCTETCHSFDSPCSPCNEMVIRRCNCGLEEKAVPCQNKNIPWKCQNRCGKLLDCQNHHCEEICHSGNCEPCALTPLRITTCFCGKEKCDNRTSCLDPILSCGKPCGRELVCGHSCSEICHEGQCPPCKVVIDVDCICGRDNVTVICGEYFLDATIAKCTRQCKKKMSCGRHTCPTVCCPYRVKNDENSHICTKICNKKLDCGFHHCEEQCHRGSCRRCPNVSFDELRCHCGAAVIYPPVYCGTLPPECSEKCTRRHNCAHEVFHNCHSDESCPPCPVLMEKQCNCGKTTRHAIPCFQTNVSCGQYCGKPLSCGHKCIKTCHYEECEPDDFVCNQQCSTIRPNCSHPCARKCHSDPCEPFDPCPAVMIMECACGRRKQKIACQQYENMKEHHRRAASKGGQGGSKAEVELRTECDAECKIQIRNKQLALALEIDQATVSSEPDIVYPESVVRFAQDKPQLAVYVETNLRRMVHELEESGDKKVEYKLHPMNKNERQFVHELSDLYCIYSTGRDIAPNRYILLIADKGKSTIPPNSLVKMLRRSGQKFNSNFPRQMQLPSARSCYN